ncbi:MAG: hypothetical protein SFY68_11475, partial [Candidatus Sumerlaeia bacterium]|nr:hypothetical protein [Candidatus Sumerlaeia bacterium]
MYEGFRQNRFALHGLREEGCQRNPCIFNGLWRMLDRLFLPQKKLDWSSQKDLRVLLYCSSDFGLGHFS